jgi:hypothetical protein
MARPSLFPRVHLEYVMRVRFFIPLALLPLALACTGAGPGADGGSGDVTVTLQGQYQDFDPATSTTTVKPIRYGYAQVVDANTNAVIASGYLGGNGSAFASIPSGRSIYAIISTAIEVPGASSTEPVLRGSVKNGSRPASFTNTAAFDAYADVTVTSSTVTSSNGTLTVTATQDSQRRAAAFNAADQMVTYALGVHAVEPTLKLPNLHAFFTTSSNVSDLPAVEYQTGGGVLLKDGRAVFTLQLAGNNAIVANANDDLNDDGVLVQAYAHQLFAPRSYPETGSGTTPQSVIRNDNDNGTNDRSVQSEPSLAFQAGFCDFLSGAFRKLNGDTNPQLIQDSYVTSGGSPVISTFSLTSHTQYSRVAGQGEFYPGSVAISTWGVWNNVLGANAASLQTLWNNTTSSAYANGSLTSFPTFLVGLRTTYGSSSATWNNILNEVALEDIPNPTAGYFAGGALWTDVSLPLSPTPGSFPTYASGIAFDRNQATSFRFVQSSLVPHTITLTTTSPGLVLELLDTFGLYEQTVATSTTNGVLSYGGSSTLPLGTYVVRVRVDPFRAYSNGTANWSLTIN